MLAKAEVKSVKIAEKKVNSDPIIDPRILSEIAEEGTNPMEDKEKITLKFKLAKLFKKFKKGSLMEKLKSTKLAKIFKEIGKKKEEDRPSFLQHHLLASSDLSGDFRS